MNWEKHAPAFVLLAIAGLIIVVVLIALRFNDRVDVCESKGGIVVRTANGYACIETKVLR